MKWEKEKIIPNLMSLDEQIVEMEEELEKKLTEANGLRRELGRRKSRDLQRRQNNDASASDFRCRISA